MSDTENDHKPENLGDEEKGKEPEEPVDENIVSRSAMICCKSRNALTLTLRLLGMDRMIRRIPRIGRSIDDGWPQDWSRS